MQKVTQIPIRLDRPRKRVRFCCSVKPSQLWWGLLPIRTINEIFRTIPRKSPSSLPPLSKGGKAQALTLLHLLTICPPFLYCKLFCRQDGGIAISSSFTSHQPFTKPHYPSKIAIILASLVKGRWIDGKAQTVALLRLLAIYPSFLFTKLFLPSRRRDCHTYRTLSVSLTPPLTIPQ